MAESTNPLVAFSDHAAQLVERAGSSIVAVHGGGRVSSSGIHWRSGASLPLKKFWSWTRTSRLCFPVGA